MLTRNCETTTTNLFHEKDFNVRVTVFDRDPKSFTPEAYKAAWIETIRDSIGGSIAHSTEYLSFTIQSEGSEGRYCFSGMVSKLLDTLKSSIYPKPESLRLDICKGNEKTRSWIFLVTKPEENPQPNEKPKYMLEQQLKGLTMELLHMFYEDWRPYSPYSGQRQMYILHPDSILNCKNDWINMIVDALTAANYFEYPGTQIRIEYANGTTFKAIDFRPATELINHFTNGIKSPPIVLRVSKADSTKRKQGEPEYIYFIVQERYTHW